MPERLGTGGGARGVGPGLHPHRDGAFDQACLGAVAGQQLGLALDDVRELAFEGLCDAGVQRASRMAQKRAISGILHERMFEQVRSMRGQSLLEQQACRDDTVK
ncbi:MAG TPA: hypothetical protein VLL28_15070 [Hyphomicrobiaceae bacterium]|nr:hypothetical protein [Hyphomicrobiaceae bacterium]